MIRSCFEFDRPMYGRTENIDVAAYRALQLFGAIKMLHISMSRVIYQLIPGVHCYSFTRIVVFLCEVEDKVELAPMPVGGVRGRPVSGARLALR